MKEVGSREFQLTYQKVKEPVKVVALRTSRVIGHFYPDGSPIIRICTICRVDEVEHGKEWVGHAFNG